MLIRISTAAIDRKSKTCTEGFMDCVKEHGIQSTDQRYWQFTKETWEQLKIRHCSQSWATAPIRAAVEVGRWLFSGAPIDAAQADHRRTICYSCPDWMSSPIPHCRICKCTSAKHHLPTAQCPANKW